MKKPRKQLLLLAALLVLILTGCEAQDLLSTERADSGSAAAGYSSYGNQIGLATGIVDEIYHDGYAADRKSVV